MLMMLRILFCEFTLYRALLLILLLKRDVRKLGAEVEILDEDDVCEVCADCGKKSMQLPGIHRVMTLSQKRGKPSNLFA